MFRITWGEMTLRLCDTLRLCEKARSYLIENRLTSQSMYMLQLLSADDRDEDMFYAKFL